jgi:hypothetical protein
MGFGAPFLDEFFQVLFGKLDSRDVLSFARREGLGEKLDKWRKTLPGIYAVLDDAEDKQDTNRAVKEWVDDLKDLAYDMEDILDVFATGALLHNLKGGDQVSTNKARNLITDCCYGLSPSAIKMRFRLGSKIKKISDRVNYLVTRKDQLNLKDTTVETPKSRRGTMASTYFVNEACVYGREKDKEAILQMLLSDKRSDAEARVSVIPIVGMAGIGKTTLAKLVLNDEKVQSIFDLKAWAWISEDYDVVRVTKAILKSVTSESYGNSDLNLLQVKLAEKLKGRKFLIVLDDMWNENYHDWVILRAPFEFGAPGSTIFITTRNKGVSSKTGTVPDYHLQGLSNDAGMSLFAQYALGANDFSAHPNLKDIGEKIVQRCKGLPLAVKALGGFLRTKRDPDEWNDVFESKIWEIPQVRSEILPALMLSYHHLPSHLKRCFVYCSLFPEDYEFEEEQLVCLWMAEGLIQPPKGDKQMEDLGSKYFRDLLSTSFFQQSNMKESQCEMSW